jgi:hypothetical protein
MALGGNQLVGVREDSRVTVMDVSDPTDPQVTDVAVADLPEPARCVAATDSLAVVGLSTGAAVIDTADGSVLGRVDMAELRLEALTALDANTVIGGDGEQIWTIDVSDPARPTATRRASAPAVVVASGAGVVWLASATGSLRTIDPADWTVAADLSDWIGDARAVVTAPDGTIAVANGGGGIILLDNADPSLAPTISARAPTPGTAHDLAVHDDGFLLVADASAGLTVLLTSGELVASLPLIDETDMLPDPVINVELAGDLAVLGSRGSTYAVDVADPRSPRLLSQTFFSGANASLIGSTAYLEELVIDLTDPTAPTVLVAPPETRKCLGADIEPSGRVAFVANTAPLTVCRVSEDSWLTPIADHVADLVPRERGTAVSVSGSDLLLLAETLLYLIDTADPAAPVRRFTHFRLPEPMRAITSTGRIGYVTSPTELTVLLVTGSLQRDRGPQPK